VTVPTTIVQTETQTATVTTVQKVPTTIYETETETETETVVQISNSPYAVTNTQTKTAISEKTATATQTAISQVTSLSVQTVEKTITVFITVQGPTVSVPTTVTETPPPPPPPPSLTGLVVCPERVINPTYTTSRFPDDYTWGCPPHKICKPKQVNCNFEADYPADSYYCSPDECIDSPPLPPDDNLEGPWPNYSCGSLYTPISGYFYAQPTSFGYDYGIFAFGGQTATPCTSTPQPVTQISDGTYHAAYSPLHLLTQSRSATSTNWSCGYTNFRW
jgi:hypothetical protein